MLEKQQAIYKELKRRMNYLQDELGYEVLFLALQGSQNYGMDIYTDEYKSDIDCMAVILPSFEDFVGNRQATSTTIVLPNNEHINIKDIRLYFELLYKQNPQFLELLFTDYKIVNKKYKMLVEPLFRNAEKIASYNLLKLYNGISGMAQEKYKALEHPYPTIIDKIEKYGYDGKQLHHIIRLYQFLLNLTGGLTFKQSLTYFVPEIKEMCMKAKLNEYSLEDAREMAQRYSNNIHSMKEVYFLTHEPEIKDEVVDILLEIKTNIFRQSFTEQLIPKEDLPFKLCPDQYHKVWVTADTHFGHNNILSYENRVDKLKVSTVEEHDEELIRRWNSVVGKQDLVIILGDFSFKKAEETNELLKRLNGDKVLVRGNHDIFLDDKKFDKSLFKAVYDYKETKYKGQEIALMHYPILDFKHQSRETKPAVLLFGHIHTFRIEIPKHSFNVGVDVNDYYPVDIITAIAKALNNTGGVINKDNIGR